MASTVVSETILIIASVIVAGALSATVMGQMSEWKSLPFFRLQRL